MNTLTITPITGLIKFTIPKTDVVHPKSGLILHYLSEYRPANKIITFTVTLPMHSDMCYLIPSQAMGKIPECNEKEATIREMKVIREEIRKNKTLSTTANENKNKRTKLTKRQRMTEEPAMASKTTVSIITPINLIKSTATTERTTKLTATTGTTTGTTSTITNTPKMISTTGTTISFKTTNVTTVTSWLTTKTTPIPTITTMTSRTTLRTTAADFNPFIPARFQFLRRRRRFIPEIIAIGAGIASTAISAVNFAQISNLKTEMRGVKESLQVLHLATVNNEAQIYHLQAGQFKLAKELGDTQTALNKTIELVNQHAEILRVHAAALRVIISQTEILRDRLATVQQAMESHFIHESIEQILAHKLNLYFVHHEDMPEVIKEISRVMNLSIDEDQSKIPMIEIITRLLVRQQIDFMPMPKSIANDNGILIGKMIFTSYFAAPAKEQDPFSIYEVVPIPFNKGQRRVQLAKMPAYLGIEPKSQQFIRWSKEEAATCDFEAMPSCRESPVRRKESEDDCMYQILTDTTLKDCRIESFPDKLFIRRIGQYWAISTSNKTNCHAVPTEDFDEHIVIKNEQVTLPEIALITVDDQKALACDEFVIPKKPTDVGTPINLIHNESINSIHKELIDLGEMLANETHWVKLPYITSNMQEVLDFISNTPKPVSPNDIKIWGDHPLSITVIAIIGTLIITVTALIIFILNRKKTGGPVNQITISMPSMKELIARETAQELTTPIF
jgi:hypothetical protein